MLKKNIISFRKKKNYVKLADLLLSKCGNVPANVLTLCKFWNYAAMVFSQKFRQSNVLLKNFTINWIWRKIIAWQWFSRFSTLCLAFWLWKFSNFPATLILCKTNFGSFQKINNFNFFTILESLNINFWKNFTQMS